MLRRTLRKAASTNRYTDGSGRKLDTDKLPRDLYVQKISNRAYPQETEHWQVAEAGAPSPFKGNVMISGGGVVGATTAAMFSLRGWHVTVVEQKPSPLERMEATTAELSKLHSEKVKKADSTGGFLDAEEESVSHVDFDEIDCALLTRRGLDIFAAAGIPLEHLRHFGMKVEGVMEHPSGFNSLLTRNLTEEHPFAVNMLALDMARLREHLDVHLRRLPGANCRVFYNHQVVAAFPERKKVVVKSMEQLAEEKREREEWRKAYDEAEKAKAVASGDSNSCSPATNDASTTNPAPANAASNININNSNNSNTLTTTGPKTVATLPGDDKSQYDGLHYDLLIDAEGANSKLRDMLDVEGFAADKIYGIKWFALDEVVEITDHTPGSGMFNNDGEFIRNPNFGATGSSSSSSATNRGDPNETLGGRRGFGSADSMLEEDEYGKVTQREKLRILKEEEEKRKEAVRRGGGATRGTAVHDEEGKNGRREASSEADEREDEDLPIETRRKRREAAMRSEEEERANDRYFYLEKTQIHRWTYPCPKGTGNTAVCIAFPRSRSVISTAEASSSSSSSASSSTTTVSTKYRNSFSVMAYFPMSVLRKMSDEEFMETYLKDLSFERKGFLRYSKNDEFSTEGGVNDGLAHHRSANSGSDGTSKSFVGHNVDTSRVSYFELETPTKPVASSVAKFSTRGKIIPFPTVYCEDLFNGIGLPSAVVIGDAAHCVNPFLMQNLSIALEDSSILLNQLDAISRHFYDSVKQYSRERGVAGDSLRVITERSLYYNKAKHYNPLVRFRNAYVRAMYRLMPARYNEYYSTNMNHLYPRSVEWMLNGRGYTSYERTEMTQTKLNRWFYIGRNYT